ncbi:EthD family reductase [Pseudomonas sp. ML96]|uniref:EthD family reductase n=1 Tax=Pseudomonas sp. ML96 TaxID=1523503 RepID=UPI0005BDB062|nr:EthD family reductase [Pseudomonas sp. ML96]
MIRMTVSYPPPEGYKFDHHYYQGAHAQLIRDKLASHGFVKLEVDRVLPDQHGVVNTSVAAAHIFFNDLGSFMAAMSAEGAVLSADRENYTDIVPVVVVSEVIQ